MSSYEINGIYYSNIPDHDIISAKALEDCYKEMLNDVYGDIAICGLSYEAAEALESVDPTAFRCGFSDYLSEFSEVWKSGTFIGYIAEDDIPEDEEE